MSESGCSGFLEASRRLLELADRDAPPTQSDITTLYEVIGLTRRLLDRYAMPSAQLGVGAARAADQLRAAMRELEASWIAASVPTTNVYPLGNRWVGRIRTAQRSAAATAPGADRREGEAADRYERTDRVEGAA